MPRQTDDRDWNARLDQSATDLWADASPSPSLRSRISADLAATTPANQNPFRRRTLALGSVAASLAFAAGTAALFMMPGTPVLPAPAFAQVQAAMSTIRTANWTVTEIGYDIKSGRERSQSHTDHWASLAPPVHVSYYTDDTAAKAGTSEGRPIPQIKMFEKEYGKILWYPRENRVWKFPLWPFGVPPERMERRRALQDYILSLFVLPGNAPGPEKYFPRMGPGEGMTLPGAKWKSSSVLLNGRRADLFIQEYVPPARPRWNPYLETRVWADPQTRRILRSEQRQWFTGNGVLSTSGHLASLTVAENFRYNQTPAPGTFDFVPPAGAKVVTRGGSIQRLLSARDRRAIENAIANSEAGWRLADFDQFGSGWDFTYPEPGINGPDVRPARLRQWKTRVLDQKKRWKAWHSQVTDVTSYRVSPNALFFRVHVRSQGKWADNSQGWQGNTSYLFLRGKDNKPRIVDWQNQALWNSLLTEHPAPMQK